MEEMAIISQIATASLPLIMDLIQQEEHKIVWQIKLEQQLFILKL